MSREYYPYYEQELIAIRHLAKEFAAQYPGAAKRLELEGGKSNDPHVERLLQGFAFLAGRVHRRLDDDFPELTQGMLNILYPHFLAPIPSSMVVEFQGDYRRDPLHDGFLIPRHSALTTPSITDETPNRNGYENLSCEYRTTYPVRVWPISVIGARFQQAPWTNLRLPSTLRIPNGTMAICQIQLQSNSNIFSRLSINDLRFHLLGGPHVPDLYEFLLTQALEVVYLPVDSPNLQPVCLHPSKVLFPVGFEEDEAMLPYPAQSFPGYRLMTEFFSFPAKFYFLDFQQLGRICNQPELGKQGAGHRIDILIFLKRTKPNLEKSVDAATFRLGCTPAVNLFEQCIEPVDLIQDRYEYRLVPDRKQPLGMEIYSIDQVTGIDPDDKPVSYRPFYAIYHETRRQQREAFWFGTRRGSTRADDPGSDMYLSLVDRNWDPLQPASQKLDIRATCTNREMSSVLQRAGDQLKLQLGMAAPLMNDPKCVRTPTTPLRPNRNSRASYWKLISHLTLNHLSFTEEVPRDRNGELLPGATNSGLASLQEILRLYNFADAEAGHPQSDINEMLVLGLTGLKTRRVVGRLIEEGVSGFARGIEVEIELDEEKYIGTGAFLFASILERFFGLYTSVNSFTQVVAKARQGERLMKRWPPRAGDRTLL
jgi:type VI secretion system protein ImpG